MQNPSVEELDRLIAEKEVALTRLRTQHTEKAGVLQRTYRALVGGNGAAADVVQSRAEKNILDEAIAEVQSSLNVYKAQRDRITTKAAAAAEYEESRQARQAAYDRLEAVKAELKVAEREFNLAHFRFEDAVNGKMKADRL